MKNECAKTMVISHDDSFLKQMKQLDASIICIYAHEKISIEKMADAAVRNQSAEDQKTEEVLTLFLQGLGFSPKYVGFTYLKEACKIALKNKSAVRSFSSYVYALVGFTYHTAAATVERSIRNSIQYACKSMGKKLFEEKLDIHLGEKEFPSCRTFICAVLEQGMFK